MIVGAVMMSLFTALIITAVRVALDGTKCQDIASKEVSYLKNFDCGVSLVSKNVPNLTQKLLLLFIQNISPILIG